MKAEIIGYITGMINSYERTIDQYEKDELPKEKYKKFDLVKEELSDLLDFVQDISEIDYGPGYQIENLSLKDYIKELEKKNEELRLENISWQKACNEATKRMSASLETKETNL